ncbi:MAG: hypothetical protein ACFFCO_11335 [Promethearchaeota archaeon]
MKPYEDNTGAQPAKLSAKEEEKSAKQIIEDYLKQVKARLPSSLAGEVIPELRSHLLEQSSQPYGRITTASAWNAVVEMGSPDIVAREFRRESEIEEEPRLAGGFINALKPMYQTWFWRIVIGLIIADVALVSIVASVVIPQILFPNPMTFTILRDSMTIAISGQALVFGLVGIAYFSLLYASYPSGVEMGEVLRSLFDSLDEKPDKEVRVVRTQRRVNLRVSRYEEKTGRRQLIGNTVGHILGALVAWGAIYFLTTLMPFYPAFEIQFITWLSFIALSRAGLTAVRAAVGDSSLPLARLLASIDGIYWLIGSYFWALIFYTPFSMPLPIPWYHTTGTVVFILWYWKLLLAPIAWIAPILILVGVGVMIGRISDANAYIQPLTNGDRFPIEGSPRPPRPPRKVGGC